MKKKGKRWWDINDSNTTLSAGSMDPRSFTKWRLEQEKKWNSEQKKERMEKSYTTRWTLVAIIGMLITVGLLAIAYKIITSILSAR